MNVIKLVDTIHTYSIGTERADFIIDFWTVEQENEQKKLLFGLPKLYV